MRAMRTLRTKCEPHGSHYLCMGAILCHEHGPHELCQGHMVGSPVHRMNHMGGIGHEMGAVCTVWSCVLSYGR
jgi:hypothetical protein